MPVFVAFGHAAPDAQAPTATTLAASQVGQAASTLNGTINPNGLETSAWFEWGTASDLATFSSTAPAQLAAGLLNVSVQRQITNLTAGTTYYFRVAAQNSLGTTRGSILSFQTAQAPIQLPPTIRTDPATGFTTTSAVLHGASNPNGASTQAWFEYGTDATLATFTSTVQQAIGGGTSEFAFQIPIGGLVPGTTYSFRAAASNSAGTARGQIRTFQSLAQQDPGVTTIQAEAFRFDGNSGQVRVSSGFPLQPAQLFEAQLSRVRVFISGVEKPIAVTALRGRFPDGSLRSIGLQFLHTLTHDVPVVVEVRIDPAGRGTTDIAWVEPTYSLVLNRAVCVPTSPAHLCASYVALVPLQPESLDSPTVGAYFGTQDSQELGEWFLWERGITSTTGNTGPGVPPADGDPTPGAAYYDHIGGLFNAWIRSGKREYFKRGYERLLDTMAGGNGYWQPGVGNQSRSTIVTWDASLAAVVTHTGAGIGSEWNSPAPIGWATSYYLTAWKQPWAKIAHNMNWEMGDVTTYAIARSVWMGSQYGIRFNLKRSLYAALVGYVTHSTLKVPGGYGPGRDPSRSYITDVQWALDALWDDRYQTGDYLDGLTGQRSTATNNCVNNGSTDAGGTHTVPAPGHFPNFQQFVVSQMLIFAYNNIVPPSDTLRRGRIETLLLTTGNFIANQLWQAPDGRWNMNYEHRPTPVTSGGTPYYIGMFAELFGFLYALTGDVKWQTWCQRAINRAQLNAFTKQMKALGEFFGGHQFAAATYLDKGSAALNGPANPTAYVEPTIYTSV